MTLWTNHDPAADSSSIAGAAAVLPRRHASHPSPVTESTPLLPRMTLQPQSWLAHFSWLTRYNIRRDLKFDVIAGITVAMMIVPQEVSLANIMHVPPQYGLYTAALTPVLYALFGSSRVLSVANGAEVSLMVGAALQNIPTEKERIAVGIFLAFYIGVINFALGCLRLGVVADFFSRPVMGGFLSAGGILIMNSQLATWFQLTLPTSTYPVETPINLFKQIKDANVNSVVVGAVSIALLTLLKYAKQRWLPAPTLADILDEPSPSIVTADHPTWGFSLNEQDYAALDSAAPLQPKASPPSANTKWRATLFFGMRTLCDLGPLVVCLAGILAGHAIGATHIKVTGNVPRGFPSPVLPWYGYSDHVIQSVTLSDVSIHAASIALVVYMTSIAMAKRLAVREHYDVHSSQELVALGLASAIGSFFQAMPPTGGMSRTAVNMQSARTQLASVITVTLVIVLLCVGTETLYYLPKASLAAIIIVAGFWLVEIDEAKWLYRSKRDEFYVWLGSFVLTLGLGILPGLLASIVCSLLAIVVKTKRPHVYVVGRRHDSGTYVSLDDDDDDASTVEVAPDVLVLRVDGSLYFGNSEFVTQVVCSHLFLRGDAPPVAIVVDAACLHDVDATTIQVLETLQVKLSSRHVGFAFANAQKHLARILQASGLCGKLAVPTVTESIDHTIARLRSQRPSPGSAVEMGI
ncbi:Aste57867_11064 [Aphanomyces stellatus]|uniref:Aste57867_11064 protein n=1 Tax=Aphanomyces stellatus TaxID=120398 RepID=A0A485KS33_9STRA|nr:hypothetical protein As57867_011022 [Aphanomyces stellatus]VFT87932.1 Aste57867_11064 [Aphanomyces stellatus]